jgi:uncharacterized protein
MTTERSGLFTIPNTAIELIRGSATGQIYEISQTVPPEGRGEELSLPTLYVLDANWLFATTCEVTRLMGLTNEVPPVRIVGIGYPDISTTLGTMALRSRDLTPTRDDSPWATVEALWPDAPAFLGTGQGAAFSEDLREVIVPHVEGHGPCESGERGLLGYSLGGLFAFHQLLDYPAVFQRYIMISPSLWWDQEAAFNKVSDWSPTAHLEKSRLFLSVGELEEPPPGEPGIPMVSEVRRMDGLLRARAGEELSLETKVFEGETHFAGLAAALSRGIRSVFC